MKKVVFMLAMFLATGFFTSCTDGTENVEKIQSEIEATGGNKNHIDDKEDDDDE